MAAAQTRQQLPEWKKWVSSLSPAAGNPQKSAVISWVWKAQEAENRGDKMLDEPLKSVPKKDHLGFLHHSSLI